MAQQPRNYQVLRDDHARAIAALNQHIEQSETPAQKAGVEAPSPENLTEQGRELATESEPKRPEKGPNQSVAWTDRGDMVSQQASTNRYNQQVNSSYFVAIGNSMGRNQEQIDSAPTNAEQNVTANEFNPHIEGQAQGTEPEKDAASNALDQYMLEQDSGVEKSSQEHDAAQNQIEQHIESQEQRQPDQAPAISAPWDAWEARVEQNELADRDAASEALDQHINNPLDQGSDIEQQPSGPELDI